SCGPMLSKKYFLGGGRNFSAPLARPTHQGQLKTNFVRFFGLINLRLFRQHRPATDESAGAANTFRRSCTDRRMGGCERCLVELANNPLRRATRQEDGEPGWRFKIRKPLLMSPWS